MTHSGYIKRIPVSAYKSQHRGGAGITAHKPKDEDFVENMFITCTHDDLMFFTNSGKVYRIKAYFVPEADRTAERINDAMWTSELSETDGVAAVSVAERYPAVFDWLKAHDVNAAVLIVVMVAVAFFNMASALLILVMERTRMIGLLKTMGMENRRIRRIFLYRAAFIVGRGLIWGNVVAGVLCGVQARFHLVKLDPSGYLLSEVPVAVHAGWWVAVNVVAALAILLLLLVPEKDPDIAVRQLAAAEYQLLTEHLVDEVEEKRIVSHGGDQGDQLL